jgi:hypothetical protein
MFTKNTGTTLMMITVWNSEPLRTASALCGVGGMLLVQAGNNAGAQCQAPDAYGQVRGSTAHRTKMPASLSGSDLQDGGYLVGISARNRSVRGEPSMFEAKSTYLPSELLFAKA